MTALYCSNTEPCFQVKGNRLGCLSELSIRLWPLRKAQCGKDGQHHNDCECPSQTRSTQHALFFQPQRRSNVQYDGCIVQSDRSLHTKAMYHCGWNQQTKRYLHYQSKVGTHFPIDLKCKMQPNLCKLVVYITLAQMISTLFFLSFFCK